MTKDEVERLVRNVIVDRRFDCTLLSVCSASTGWNVMVRAGTGGLVRFALSTQRAIAARVAIEEILETEL